MIKLFYLTQRWTLTGIITPGQSGPGSNGSEVVFLIPHCYRTGVLPSDGSMTYPGH